MIRWVVALVLCLRLTSGEAVTIQAPPDWKVQRVQPAYPKEALFEQTEGSVTMQLGIGRAGKVEAIRILETDPPGTFEEAASDALRQWRYRPKCSKEFSRSFTEIAKVNFRINNDLSAPGHSSDAITIEWEELKFTIMQTSTGLRIETVDPCQKRIESNP